MRKKDIILKIIMRIASLTGSIFLIGLYLSTIIAALSSSPNFERYLMGSIATTVFVPTLIYILQWLSKFFQGR